MHEKFIIHFEDRDRPIEIFCGEGATEAARKRFQMILTSWNAQLFRMIDDGKRLTRRILQEDPTASNYHKDDPVGE